MGYPSGVSRHLTHWSSLVPTPRAELSVRDWQLRDLVRDFLVWPTATPPPVLLLTGPPGSGKSTLLGLLRPRLAEVPHAYADLAAPAGAVELPLVSQLGGLAFQLRGRFGSQP